MPDALPVRDKFLFSASFCYLQEVYFVFIFLTDVDQYPLYIDRFRSSNVHWNNKTNPSDNLTKMPLTFFF